MIPFPIQIAPDEVMRQLLEANQKVIRGLETLSHIREEDIPTGVSAKEVVFTEDKLTLYHYTPLVEKPFAVPVLISYALVNRPYMTDLQENRSLVRNLLKLGIDVYLIDWGYPGREDRWLTLDDYINSYIDDCVDEIRSRHNLEQINLLGICQGGTFSLCYAALHPEKIKNLITMVTPVDFEAEKGLLNTWVGCAPNGQHMNVELMVEALGNISGEFMNYGYIMLKPFQLSMQKYLALGNILDDRDKVMNFMRMEKWIFDSPDQAGEAWLQFTKDFYQGNKLVKAQVELGEKRVDLGNITMPVLNIYAEEDHLVPPESSMALEQHVGTQDYTVRSFPTGHIGMYVSGKVQRDLPPTIAEWLKERV